MLSPFRAWVLGWQVAFQGVCGAGVVVTTA